MFFWQQRVLRPIRSGECPRLALLLLLSPLLSHKVPLVRLLALNRAVVRGERALVARLRRRGRGRRHEHAHRRLGAVRHALVLSERAGRTHIALALSRLVSMMTNSTRRALSRPLGSGEVPQRTGEALGHRIHVREVPDRALMAVD